MHPTRPLLNLGVLASGKGSNFQAIAEHIYQGHLHARIRVVIYNNPGATVASKAQVQGIPAVLLDHRQYPQREALDQAIVEVLQAYGVELVVMAGWMRLVTPVLITAFPERIVNIHPSLLPSFKGAKAVEQALSYGVKVTGCTVHLVELAVDSGAVLAQRAVPVLPGDTVQTLAERIQIQEHEVLPEVLQHFALEQVQIQGREVWFKTEN
ncbi:phosphoribosylglycinamide formyltransferase [Anthocerotibacter panamensis]|uniref:phosphoribosylglycinamide formyltransferase n=1 Tax=Anthocerotibacter panamensis TaxID=2857077 RepID=UPI001C40566A|nr:phosphoribosylglycinamide formyltransferase [Anthocerotibacter panamensis]